MADVERQVVPNVTSPEDEALLRQVAAEYGVEIERTEETRDFGIVVGVFIVFGAAAAVAGAVSDYLERKKGGQVIDLRRDAEDVAYRDEGVVYGLIVVIAEDGKVTVDVKEPKGFFLNVVNEVLASMTKLGEKTLDTIADAAKSAASATGAKADVTVEAVG